MSVLRQFFITVVLTTLSGRNFNGCCGWRSWLFVVVPAGGSGSARAGDAAAEAVPARRTDRRRSRAGDGAAGAWLDRYPQDVRRHGRPDDRHRPDVHDPRHDAQPRQTAQLRRLDHDRGADLFRTDGRGYDHRRGAQQLLARHAQRLGRDGRVHLLGRTRRGDGGR